MHSTKVLVSAAAFAIAGAVGGCNCGGAPDPGVATSQISMPAANALISGNPIVLSGTATSERSALAKVEVSIDDGSTWHDATGTAAWEYQWVGAPDGAYTVRSRASTEGGYVEEAPPSVHFTVDNTAPQVSVTSPAPNALLVGASQTLAGTASDANGVANVELSFDGGATWVAAAGTASWSYAWTAAADGEISVQVRAKDAAGNTSPPVALPVVMDRELPTSSISSPANGAVLAGGAATLSGTAASAHGAIALVEISTDNGVSWSAATGTDSFSFLWTLPADGTYRLRSRARDGYGGYEAMPGTVQVVVDQTAPQSRLSTAAQTVRGASFALQGTASDPLASDGSASDVVRVEVSTDDGATWADATGTHTWSYAWTLPADGSYVVRTRATDAAGNVEVSAAGTVFIVDNTAPAVAVSSPAAGQILVGTAHALAGTASDGQGVSLVEVSFDQGATWTAAAGTTSWAYAWTPLPPDGPFTLYVRSTDLVGNVSAPSTVGVVIDRELPASTIAVPLAGAFLTGGTAAVNGTAASTYSTVAEVSFSADDGATWTQAAGTNSWTASWTLPADGTYHLRSRARDVLGGYEAVPQRVAVVVDQTAPGSSITTPAGPIAVKGTSYTFSGTAFDPKAADGSSSGVESLQISTDDGATWSAVSGTTSWSHLWTLPADGVYAVRIRARDRAGNAESSTSSLSITADNTRPSSQITSPAAGSTIGGTSVTVSGTASDNLSGVQRVEISTNGGLTWATATGTTTWSYQFTPGADGAFSVTTRAVDAAGNVEDPAAPYIFTVDGTAPGCAITDPFDGETVSGTTFTVAGTSSDATSGIARVELSTDGGATWSVAAGTTSWSYAFTPPGGGSYVFRCRATDRAGNAGTSPAVNVTVDTSYPWSRITAPASGAASSASSYTITGTAGASAASITLVEVSTDNGATWTVAAGTSAWTYSWSGIAEGTYTLRARATNSNGTRETSSPAATVTFDRTSPVSAVTSPPSGTAVSGTAATISGIASDGLSGVALVEISFDDGATYVPVTSGTTSWSYTWTLPADGSYSIRTRATDRAGNAEVPAANTILKVDNTAPASAISDPVAGAAIAGTQLTIRGTASDVTTSVARVEISTDGGATWTQATGQGVWSYTWTLPADGTYTLMSRAHDAAGNVEAPGAGISVTVDNTAPSSAITDPVMAQVIGAGTYLIRGTATDGSGSGVVRVDVSTDGGATWGLAPKSTYTQAIGLSGLTSWSYSWTPGIDGAYLLLSRAVDAAGNVELSSSAIAVLVDRIAPVTAISTPAGGANLSGSTAAITGTAADTGSGTQAVMVSTDNGLTWAPATLSGSTWTYSWALPADGSYTLRSRGMDAAGNIEVPSAGTSVKVDNTAPTSSITSPASGAFVSGSSIAVSGSASDATSGVSRVEVSTDGGATWSPAGGTASWTFSFSPASDGSYSLKSRAVDAAGNVQTPPAGITLTVDNSKPSSAITDPVVGQNVRAATYTIRGTAADTGSGVSRVEVSTNAGATWTAATGTTSWSYSWTTGIDGTYLLASRAVDAAGNVELISGSVTVLVDRTPPATAISTPASGASVKGTVATVTGTAVDTGSGVQEVEVSTDNGLTWAPATLSGGTWTYSWTLPADGTYALRSRGMDLAGNLEAPSAGHTVKVDNTAPTSAIAYPANASIVSASPVVMSGSANDATSGVVRVEISTDGGATWQAASGGSVWSYTWSAPEGTFTLKTRAVDAAGNVEAPGAGITVTIDTTRPTSAIADPAAGQNISSSTYVVQGTAADGAGSGVSRVEVSTNGGTTWSTASGTTSWTFTWSTAADGLYTVVSRALDLAGNVEATGAGVTVRVDRTAPATTIVSPSDGANLKGALATLTGLVAEGGSGVQKVEVSTNGGATWVAATVSGTTWTYSWTLPADGSYTLQSRGTDLAGNVETPQAGNAVKVDNTPPSSAITSPANGSAINATTYTVAGTCSDGSGSGVVKVEVSTDNGATWNLAAVAGGATWTYSWSTGADGSHQLRSRATDRVGLVETPGAGNSVFVDHTAPSSAITSPANGTGISTLTQVITGTASDGTGSGVAGVQVSTDGGATWAWATGTTSWSYTWTLPSAAGAYNVRTRAVDNAGSLETPGAGFTYNALPAISTIVPSSTAAGALVTLAGFRFGATQGSSTVTFNGVAAARVLSWSAGSVRLAVPATATTGNAVATVSSLQSVGVPFTVLLQPVVGATTVTAGGANPSIKLGADALPRIAHVNAAQVSFTSYAAGAWSTVAVDNATTARSPSLAIDANGANHLSYSITGTGSSLKYAFCPSACSQAASWTVTTVLNNATGAGTGVYTAIALDTQGRPRIAFYDQASAACGGRNCARYASYDGSAWTLETIDSLTATDVGQYISLAVDSTDKPHAAYYDAVNRNLVYANRGTGGWGPITLIATNRVGQFTSMALKNDSPRISFIDQTSSNLDAFFYDSGTWTWHQAIDAGLSSTKGGAGTSITVGNDGVERIVYARNSGNPVTLWTVSYTGTGTTWTAPAQLTTGSAPSSALDGLNRIRAAYQTGTSLGYYAAP